MFQLVLAWNYLILFKKDEIKAQNLKNKTFLQLFYVTEVYLKILNVLFLIFKENVIMSVLPQILKFLISWRQRWVSVWHTSVWSVLIKPVDWPPSVTLEPHCNHLKTYFWIWKTCSWPHFPKGTNEDIPEVTVECLCHWILTLSWGEGGTPGHEKICSSGFLTFFFFPVF